MEIKEFLEFWVGIWGLELIPSIPLSLKTVGFRMSPEFGIKSRQNSQIQAWEWSLGIPSRIRAGLESRKFQKSPPPKKKSWNSSQTPSAGGNHGLHIPTGNPGGKRGKDSKKNQCKQNRKRVHSGEKNQGKRQDSIGIFMGKKKELREWNRGMIGRGKKPWKKANQFNPIRPRILGAKFQGKTKTAFPLPPAAEKQEKWEFPHSQVAFGGKTGFPWILSNWKRFSWNSHSKETMPGFFGCFFWEYLGNAGKFQRGGIEEMLRREEGASGKRDRNLREPGIYPGFPYSRRIPGKSRKRGRGAVCGGMFSTGKRRRSREKGGEKAEFSSRCTSSNSQVVLVPSSWKHQDNSGEGKLYGSQGGWDQSGADPSAGFPGFSRISSSPGFLTPAQKDQDGSSSQFLGFLTFSTTKSTFFSFPGLQLIPNFSTSNESHGNDPESSQNPNF